MSSTTADPYSQDVAEEHAGAFDGMGADANTEIHDDANQYPESDGTGEKVSRTRSRPASRSRGAERGLVRRVATKSVDLAAAAPRERELLASLLGSGTEIVELTVAVMTAPRGALSVLGDVKDLAEAGEAERAVLALTMGKPRMKTLWSVLADLGVVSGGIPASDAKAALALSRADLNDDARARVERVATLARRGY